jgi:hypothetical protein
MDDLVLVPKISKADALENARTGRPKRMSFALRHYANACTLALPQAAYEAGDHIDFYLSKAGFAAQIGPDCSRAISGRKGSQTASVPLEIRKQLDGLAEGSHDLIASQRPDGIWFFPFSQFGK